jgi:hypothetical protein
MATIIGAKISKSTGTSREWRSRASPPTAPAPLRPARRRVSSRCSRSGMFGVGDREDQPSPPRARLQDTAAEPPAPARDHESETVPRLRSPCSLPAARRTAENALLLRARDSDPVVRYPHAPSERSRRSMDTRAHRSDPAGPRSGSHSRADCRAAGRRAARPRSRAGPAISTRTPVRARAPRAAITSSVTSRRLRVSSAPFVPRTFASAADRLEQPGCAREPAADAPAWCARRRAGPRPRLEMGPR